MLQRTTYASPLGEMTLLADADAVCGLWFNDQAYFGGRYALDTVPTGTNPALLAVQEWLAAYFNGEAPNPQAVPVRFSGTPFQVAVWQALQTIPSGETTTYGQLAAQVSAKLGHSAHPRAIGSAVGHNPISVLVPCHRVLGATGQLTGYAGGIERKRALLRLEGALVAPV